MTRVYRVAAVAMLVLLVPAGLAFGQATTATVRGRVHDSQGRPVPSAIVTVTGRDTGLTREVPVDGDGGFAVAGLPPSLVDVTVAASGFTDAKRSGIVLEVGQSTTVDVDFAVAGVQERIDVSSRAVGVDTTRSVVDAVLPSAAIEALPLNGRNFLELALLVPGNAPAPNFDPTKSNSVVISSAGQLGRGGNITIDGIDNNDDVVGGPLQNVTQEAVQEFQIATNRFSAESGRSASSLINVVTQSGSDQLKGSVARSSATAPGRRCRRRSIARRATRCRSIASRSPARWAAPSCQAGVLVRRGRVSQPGRRRAGRRARRRRHGRSGGPSRRRRSTTSWRPAASTGGRTPPTA